MPAQQVPLSSDENQRKKMAVSRKRNIPQGRKHAFAIESITRIKSSLIAHSDTRGLALLLTSLDTCLRSIDLLSLRVSDVCDHNLQVVERFEYRQAKTQRNVACSLTPATRAALAALIALQHKTASDYLWTPKANFHAQQAITRVMYRRIVKGWARAADLDPRRFSGHSTRRTKVTILYAKTRDVKACATLLGHQNLGHTAAYIGSDSAAALDLALTITF